MGQIATKEKEIPKEFLCPETATPWPQNDIRRAILQKKLAPFYPPLPDECDDDVRLYPCNICFFTYQGPLNRCESCGNFICTNCFCNIMSVDEWRGRCKLNSARCPYCKTSKWKVKVTPRTPIEIERLFKEQQRVIELQSSVRHRELEEEKRKYNERISSGEIGKLITQRENEKKELEKRLSQYENTSSSVEQRRTVPNLYKNYIPQSILSTTSDIAKIEEKMMEIAFAESMREMNGQSIHVSQIQQVHIYNSTVIVSTSGPPTHELNGSIHLTLPTSDVSSLRRSNSQLSQTDFTFSENDLSNDAPPEIEEVPNTQDSGSEIANESPEQNNESEFNNSITLNTEILNQSGIHVAFEAEYPGGTEENCTEEADRMPNNLVENSDIFHEPEASHEIQSDDEQESHIDCVNNVENDVTNPVVPPTDESILRSTENTEESVASLPEENLEILQFK